MKLSDELSFYADDSLVHAAKVLEDENEALKERLNFIHDKALSMDLALAQMEQVLLRLSTGG